MIKKSLRGLFLFTVYLFLYAPIIVLIVYSFNSGTTRGAFEGFSFKWYKSLFEDSQIMSALGNTLSLAFLSAIISTIIGTFTAYGIHHLGKKTKSLMLNVNYLPVLNPDIVTGVSLLILFVFMGMTLGYSTLLLSHIIFNIPYVIISVLPKFKQFNNSIYEAAIDLGASPLKAFMKVVVPEIMPGIISGFLIAVTLSIDDFVISFFTTGSGVTTLSISIYSMARKGIKPEINALSSLLFISIFVLLILVNSLSKDEDKKPEQRR